ncbi:MAG: hypothetical protein ATN35_06575 [Epulopiscium sp. Nele67-Bin004]|nr:MAG: hypothetical protein ATN35_06575 [Epulopiscium sp. Nele67-Bin004]
MIAVGKVDIGNRRAENQDRIFISNEPIGGLPNLYIVADGMGGHQSGEIASEMSINSFCEYIMKYRDVNIDTPENVTNLLVRGIKDANHIVFSTAKDNQKYKGMGTTFSVVTIINEVVYISHIGDTRVYAMNERQILQLTTDHSLVQEMYEKGGLTKEETHNHPLGHIITRSLGTEERIKVDSFMCDLKNVDYILLCSDGLTNMLTDDDILEIVYSEAETISQIVDKLVDMANIRGGNDNIAVILRRKSEVV